MTAVKEQYLSSRQSIAEKAEAALAKLREDHGQEWEQLSQRNEELQDSRRQLDSEFVHLQYYKPCGNEILIHQQAIEQFKRSSALLEAELKALDSEISKLTLDYENRTALLKASFESEIRDLDKELAQYRDKINGIDTLLARASGSLYEWLDGKMPGWEKNIGKVIDQDRILSSRLWPHRNAIRMHCSV